MTDLNHNSKNSDASDNSACDVRLEPNFHVFPQTCAPFFQKNERMFLFVYTLVFLQKKTPVSEGVKQQTRRT